ncbi:uncharacterized protein LOC101020164 [Papio anubis]|uniref:uncharacterized protein LOC101020164 n=1 Tax=Papio anubis TaxID=9555 RepID=UPI0012AE35FE|nr:uncharacterized protein LOC101020164 [Papio anubis]
MEIILELQQSAQLHNREAGTQIDRQISQLVEGASGWQLWAFGCWTTIGKTEMEQGQKIAHFYSTQLLLFHDLQEFYWDNCPNKLQAFYPNGALAEMKRTLSVKIGTRREWNTQYGYP